MPRPKFAEGERVLCFHGPLIYEAKCLKVSTAKDKVTPKYFIHYAGWNKNWDEWVPESRILKYNDVNLAKQADVKVVHNHQVKQTKKTRKSKLQSADPSDSSSESGSSSGRKESKTSTVQEVATSTVSQSTNTSQTSNSIAVQNSGKTKREPTSRTSTPTNDNNEGPKRKKLKTEASNSALVPPKNSHLKSVEIKFSIPKELNMILVDDWNLVVREKKLLTLPAKTTALSVLDNFTVWKKKQAETNNENFCIGAMKEFVEGIKDYFNVMLGSQLLYRFERVQYAEMLEKYPDKKMVEVYGSFHLLRLFVRLGGVLAHTRMDEKCAKLLQFQVQEFLKYLVKENRFDFLEFYTASPEYVRKTL